MKKLYLLLLVLFAGFSGKTQVIYESPICINSTSAVMPMFSPDTPMGGIFSSQVGIVINPLTGQIDLAVSASGTYVITYDVPASPPSNPAMSYSCVVVLTSPITPNFTPHASPICSSNPPPTMPSVSNNGISGIWTMTETNVDNFTSLLTYTFAPDFGQCAVSTTMTIVVSSPYAPVITTANESHTVYVDDNNQVVAPLELLSGQPDGYTFEWSEGTSFIPGATAINYTVNTASPTGDPRMYRVFVTNTETGCHTFSSPFIVYQSTGTPPPFADRNQTLPSGATLADVLISGNDVRWYSSASDKNNNTVNSIPLPMNTVLVDGTTYYATQTVNGSESVERLPVTVQLALGINGNEWVAVSYYPNPVKNTLIIKASSTIESISVMNVLGQVLKTSNYNQTEVVENMTDFTAGTYFLRVISGSRTEVIKIIKQ